MAELPPCPQCQSPYAYADGLLLTCPECGHEWDPNAASEDDGPVVLDAHGTRLQDGDSVLLIKDLKLKGSSTTLKIGTRVNHIRLCEGDHNIDCRIAGIGGMKLKSEFVKKA